MKIKNPFSAKNWSVGQIVLAVWVVFATVFVLINAWQALNHTLDFEIHVIADGKTSEATEEILDDFRKLIWETLEENNQLKNPSTGLDPVVSTSYLRSASHENRGTLKQKHVYNLHCLATT